MADSKSGPRPAGRHRFRAVRAIVAACALVLALAGLAEAQDRVSDTVRIPLDRIEMTTELHRPAGPGPFPVVVFAHGRPVDHHGRTALARSIPRDQAAFWVRRGFAVVAPFRPGYGPTGGTDVEALHARNCERTPDYRRIAEAAGRPVEAAIAWAQQQPWARRDRILLVGTSVGALGVLAAAARQPEGVVAYVDFSGGAGALPRQSPGRSCRPDIVTALFAEYGRSIRIPGLWLYAENDLAWGPEVPKIWHKAFAEGGARSSFVMTPAVPGVDGNLLMLRGQKLWAPIVRGFIASLMF